MSLVLQLTSRRFNVLSSARTLNYLTDGRQVSQLYQFVTTVQGSMIINNHVTSMTPQQDSSIHQRQQLQATLTRSGSYWISEQQDATDVLSHCSEIPSTELSLIHCPRVIYMQLTSVTEDLTQYVLKNPCLSNK
jgi:hypothetical protein